MNVNTDFSYAPDSRKARDWQHALTEQFKLLDTLCHENGIKYTIAFGGLLGTVRHRGFIPWDNDVDIVVTEEDYLRLRQVYLDGKMPQGYLLADRVTEPTYPLLFGRFVNTNTSCPLSTSSFNGGAHGTFIDVFITYPISSDRAEQIETIERFQVWEELQCYLKRRSSYRTQGFFEKWQALKAYEAERGHEAALAHAEEQFRQSLPTGPSEWYLFNSTGNYLGYPLVRQEWYEHTVRLPFGTIEVDAPAGYLRVLQTVYGGSWREFPVGERFTHYSASSLNVPSNVIREDYMQLMDTHEVDEEFRTCKDVLMEEALALREHRCLQVSNRSKLRATELAVRLEHKVHARGFSERRPYAQASFAELEQACAQTELIVREHNRPTLRRWRLALPLEADLLSAALWNWYATKPDYWTVSRIVGLQDGDPAHQTFDARRANIELRNALAATDELYLALDAHDAATVATATATLEHRCANGWHTAVGRAFCLLENDPRSCLDFIDSLAPTLQASDYLTFARARALLALERTAPASEALEHLGAHCTNGMLLQAARDLCATAGLTFKATAKPVSNDEDMPALPALKVERFARMRNPHIKLCLLKLRKSLAQETKLEERLHIVSKRAEPHVLFTEHCRELRRLTSDRFAVWERTYPRKKAIQDAQTRGDITLLRTLIMPYLDAIYRLMDNSGLGVFIDQELLDIALPLVRADRGDAFAEAYLAAIPPTHREDIDHLLARKGVQHPYLVDPKWAYLTS